MGLKSGVSGESLHLTVAGSLEDLIKKHAPDMEKKVVILSLGENSRLVSIKKGILAAKEDMFEKKDGIYSQYAIFKHTDKNEIANMFKAIQWFYDVEEDDIVEFDVSATPNTKYFCVRLDFVID